ALFGPSGAILDDGTQVQFSKAGVTVLLEGPSGYVFSDGTLVQKKS
uniref:Cuticular protein isoform HACP4.6a n=3 Tax=Homarus americanus TaxID=6706 RepID=Q7M4A2_HOMAM